MSMRIDHVLALFDVSGQGRQALRAGARLAEVPAAKLTVTAVAVLEDQRGCCDLRSDIWNRLQREAAAADVQLAKQTCDAVDASIRRLRHVRAREPQSLQRHSVDRHDDA